MICPTPEKRVFTSRTDAQRALHAIKNPWGRMHAYRCGTHWHIGHHDHRTPKRARTGRKAR